VTLAEHQLTTRLQVDNTGVSTMEFQALLHTYHLVPAKQVKVTPLKGLTYLNKTKPGTPKEVENRDAVDVLSFTDFVYENALAASDGLYLLGWEGKSKIEVRCIGFEDLVIWNPGQGNGAKMGDMEEGGW
jgi:glucose-6-phosphate 1-epimerase